MPQPSIDIGKPEAFVKNIINAVQISQSLIDLSQVA